MSEEMLEKIKSTHENITIAIGTLLSLVLIGYFMTYSNLADSKHSGLFWFEMISSIFIAFGLYYVQRIAFALLKLRYISNQPYKEAVASITLNDLK